MKKQSLRIDASKVETEPTFYIFNSQDGIHFLQKRVHRDKPSFDLHNGETYYYTFRIFHSLNYLIVAVYELLGDFITYYLRPFSVAGTIHIPNADDLLESFFEVVSFSFRYGTHHALIVAHIHDEKMEFSVGTYV